MQSEQIISILHIGFIICLVLTVVFAGLSVFLFFQFKIRDVFNAITGRAQRKSVQQMEEENAKTGKLRADYYSTPTSSDLYTTPSGRIPPVVYPQQDAQAAGTAGMAEGSGYTEQIYPAADAEGRRSTAPLHANGQTAASNSGGDATTLLNSGSEETTLLNNGSDATTLLNSGSEETTLLNRTAAQSGGMNAEFGETTLLTPGMDAAFTAEAETVQPEWNFVIKKEIIEIHTDELI